MTNATKVVYSDNPPASYTIYTNGNVLPKDIHKVMNKFSAAGVEVLIYASGGEVPFIATEIQTTESDLQTQSGDNIVDDAGSQITVDYELGIQSDKLQIIFEGEGFGLVETLNLTTDTGDTIVTDEGHILVCHDENQNIVGKGKANLSYQ